MTAMRNRNGPPGPDATAAGPGGSEQQLDVRRRATRSRMGGVWIIFISAAFVLLLLLIFICRMGNRPSCPSSVRTEPCRWGWRVVPACGLRCPARRAARHGTHPATASGRPTRVDGRADRRPARRARSVEGPMQARGPSTGHPQFVNTL
jgi:hypothetical protein